VVALFSLKLCHAVTDRRTVMGISFVDYYLLMIYILTDICTF